MNKNGLIHYNFIRNETKLSPKMYSYEDDEEGKSIYLVMPSGYVFGLENAPLFTTLKKIKDENDVEGILKQLYLTDASAPSKEELQQFIMLYEQECSDIKKELNIKLVELKVELKDLSLID